MSSRPNLTPSFIPYILHMHAMHPRPIHLTKNICTSSASWLPYHTSSSHTFRALTHRHTRHEPTDRDNPPNFTHIRRAMLRHKFVYERRERVEQEILNHHLQDEYLGGVGAEGVATGTISERLGEAR